jgi:hypothetical protein
MTDWAIVRGEKGTVLTVKATRKEIRPFFTEKF